MSKELRVRVDDSRTKEIDLIISLGDRFHATTLRQGMRRADIAHALYALAAAIDRDTLMDILIHEGNGEPVVRIPQSLHNIHIGENDS